MPPSAGYQTDLKQTWLKAIQNGLAYKQQVYEREAEQCEVFYDGDQRGIYKRDFTSDLGIIPDGVLGDGTGIDGNSRRAPRFNIRDNRAAAAVQIYIPMFLQGEMVASVTPNKPYTPPPQMFGVIGDPNQPQPIPPPGSTPQDMQRYVQQEMARQQYFQIVQQAEMEYTDRIYRSSIIEDLDNYLIKECNMKEEARPALRDTIVRGLGALMTERVSMPDGSGSLVGASYLDDDRIVIDPDAKRLKDAKWVAILCEHNVWEVARDYQVYGITEQDLRADSYSTTALATSRDMNRQYNKNIFRYWKIYSRCGIGARLKAVSDRDPTLNSIDAALGDNCYIVVSEGCDYPLNITPAIEQMTMQMQSIQPFQVATSWPVPFYADKDDPFPFTACWFHERKGSSWPKAHLSFAIGYLNFMAWILGFVAEKAYRDSRGVWCVDETMKPEFVEWLKNGQDEEIISFTKGPDGSKTVKSLVEYIQGPEFNGSLIELYQFMDKQYQDITGITELLQGQMDRQMRSAEEANVLQSASQLRPRDMADKVSAWLARVVRKNTIAARWLLTGQDLVSVLGNMGAMAWQNGIMTKSIPELFREATYSVEVGKGRVPDVNAELENINQAMQFVFPPMMQTYQMSGDPSSVNGLLTEWAKVRQMKNIDSIMLKPFMPPPPPDSPEGQAAAEQVKEDKAKEKEKAK